MSRVQNRTYNTPRDLWRARFSAREYKRIKSVSHHQVAIHVRARFKCVFDLCTRNRKRSNKSMYHKNNHGDLSPGGWACHADILRERKILPVRTRQITFTSFIAYLPLALSVVCKKSSMIMMSVHAQEFNQTTFQHARWTLKYYNETRRFHVRIYVRNTQRHFVKICNKKQKKTF